MSKLLRGAVSAWGARKLTGGCGCGALIVFALLYWLLGASGIDIFQ